jgi:hypothetical protein
MPSPHGAQTLESRNCEDSHLPSTMRDGLIGTRPSQQRMHWIFPEMPWPAARQPRNSWHAPRSFCAGVQQLEPRPVSQHATLPCMKATPGASGASEPSPDGDARPLVVPSSSLVDDGTGVVCPPHAVEQERRRCEVAEPQMAAHLHTSL